MPTNELVQGVLAGNRRALARLITQIENNAPHAADALARLFPHTGRAYLVGITGAPGTGKSTVVNGLARVLRQREHTVAIVAVDPTSPFSGGAVLGDRIRMNDLSGDRGIFIRSMASRGNLGGLATATSDVVRALDAAGFDYVLVETVGAGQSEVDIARMAYTTLVLDAPGLGDDVQAIKAGILEIADILVINKADRPGVQNTVRALRAMLEMGHRFQTTGHHGPLLQTAPAEPEYDFWQVPILKTVALQNEGLEAVADAIDQHRAYLDESGQRTARERLRVESELTERLRSALLEQLLGQHAHTTLENVIQRVVSRELAPAGAVEELLKNC